MTPMYQFTPGFVLKGLILSSFTSSDTQARLL
jgi:hypothetical protein